MLDYGAELPLDHGAELPLDHGAEQQFSSPCLPFSETSVLGESNGDGEADSFSGNSWEFGARQGGGTKWRGNGASLRGACPLAQGWALPQGDAAALRRSRLSCFAPVAQMIRADM